tara:strand:- start:48 stop:245 length:198 start_codon:yes stop_codon:yes gene_type:complete
MNTLSIHRVTKLEMTDTRHHEKDADCGEFEVRNIIITDENGTEIRIQLFSYDCNNDTLKVKNIKY